MGYLNKIRKTNLPVIFAFPALYLLGLDSNKVCNLGY